MENVRTRGELIEIVKNINGTAGFEGMHLELASDENVDAMVDFLIKDFFPSETITNSIGLVIDETFKPMLIQRFKADNLSLLLIDDVTNDVIGVRTMVLRRKDDSSSSSKIKDEKVRTVYVFFGHKNEEMDVFGYYDVDIVFHWLNLGVRKDYRRRGLASKLVESALIFCKQVGLKKPCVVIEATSIYSQRIFEKFSFETLHTLNFEDYKIDGEVVFKNTGSTKATVVYVKKL